MGRFMSLILILHCFGIYSANLIMEGYEDEMSRVSPPFKYIFQVLADGQIYIEDLSLKVLPASTAKDVTIYFYSSSNPDKGINVTNVNFLRTKTNFDTSKESVFIVHGWREDYTSEVCTVITRAILEKHDVNVFVVDWGSFAKKSYVTAFVNVPRIGKIVGEYIIRVSSAYNYSLSLVRGVGFSLGAHVIGVAGKTTNGAIALIIGLDPAGPLFTGPNTHNRVTKESAQHVQIIHTCGKFLGLYLLSGHVDIFANGGLSQPGCGIIKDIGGTCSHSRAYEYYAESILSGGFNATKCGGYYGPFLAGFCTHNEEVKMGGYDVDTEVSEGKYYVKTNSEPPYALEN